MLTAEVSLLLQPLNSICMADDRKVELDHSALGALPLPKPSGSTAAGHPAAEVAGQPSYTLWLQYQQQVVALQSTMSAAAASHPNQKGPLSQVSSPPAFSASLTAPPPLEVPSNLYFQPASLYNQLQERASSLLPHAEPASMGPSSQTPTQEAHGRASYIMGTQGKNRDYYAMLAQQSLVYAAEQEQQQQQVAAWLQAIAAGASFSQGEVGSGSGPGPPLLRDPSVGLGRAPAQFNGET